MADSVPLDVSKYLPPSFFEGLADSFMQNLSNSIGKKILAIKASTGSKDKSETLADGIKSLAKDSTAKGMLKTLLEDIGLISRDKGKKEDKKDDKKEKVVDKKESDNKGILSYIGQFFGSNKNKDEEKKTLEEENKPALTIIDGLSPNAQKVLHKIIGESVTKRKDKTENEKDEEPKKGSTVFKMMFGGLALLAGGLFALYEGLKDDGPFKGLLKLVGRVGLRGAEMMFKSIGKVVTKGLKMFSSGILSGIKSFFGFSAKAGAEVLGKEGGGRLLKMFSGIKSWLGRMFAKIGMKIPGIGAIIGIGFAVSRFMKGDIVGGIIDLLSGMASCINFVLPGMGFAISLGLDALNAFLDYKAGGTPDAGGKGKGSMIWGWIKDAGKWMGEKFGDVIVALPVIGPLIRSIAEFSQGNFLKGLKQMAYIFPPIELVGALLGDEDVPATQGVQGALGSVWGMIKSLGEWASDRFGDTIVQLPVIGPLVRSIGEFSQGNFLKGLKQMAYIVPIFELVGALLGDEDVPATQGVQGALGSVWGMIKSLGEWASEKFGDTIVNLPVIGPLVRSIGEFSQGNFLKGLKQMAYIVPIFELVGALLGDEEVGGVAKAGAGAIGSIWDMIKSLGEWASKKFGDTIVNLPVIGPLVRSIGEFSQGNFLKGLKQMAYIVPIFELVGALLGDEEVGGVAKAGAGVITSIGGMFASLGKWIKEKIMKVPILGGLLKGIGQIYDGDVMKGLKTMGMSVPILRNIISFFSDDNEQESGQAPPPKQKGVFAKLKDMILEKARAWWKDTSLQWLARRILPDSIISELDNNNIPPEQSEEEKKAFAIEYAKNKSAKREKAIAERVKAGIQSPEATPVGDAMINPNGGLIVSSQSSGKIYNLSKTDGVVAAPFTQESKPSLNLDGSKLLGDIESNTGDTNKSIVKLAEAMFKIMGIIGENSSKQGVNVYPTMTQQPQQKNDAQALQSISNAIQGIRNEFLSSIYQS